MSDNQKILEIGVGNKRVFNNSICIDIRITPAVDIISDARYLPFKNAKFEKIFSSHVIEHFSHSEAKSVIFEWTRVLKDNGEIELRCPDLRARAFFFALRPSWEDIYNIYGEQNYQENYHKCGFSFKLLKQLLIGCQITQIRRIWDGYKGIPYIPCDLHIKGKKSENK